MDEAVFWSYYFHMEQLNAICAAFYAYLMEMESRRMYYDDVTFHILTDRRPRRWWVRPYILRRPTHGYRDCNLKRAMERNVINIPPPEALEINQRPIGYFLIGDGAFPLKSYLQKP